MSNRRFDTAKEGSGEWSRNVSRMIEGIIEIAGRRGIELRGVASTAEEPSLKLSETSDAPTNEVLPAC